MSLFTTLRQAISGKSPEAVPPAPRRRIDLATLEPRFAIYAVGDIHGRLDLLLEAEQKIQKDVEFDGDGGNALVVMLGDYIDRGPDSAGVIDHLTKPPPNNLRRITLCGNHESVFCAFLDAPRANLQWLGFGGRQTLLSYGIDAEYFLSDRKRSGEEFQTALIQAVPAAHRTFLETLPVLFRIGNYVFVHAGLRPGIPLEQQIDQDLLWIREPFLSQGAGSPYFVIHGHTPVLEPQTGPRRICIDTGAVTTGRLTVLKLKNDRAFIL